MPDTFNRLHESRGGGGGAIKVNHQMLREPTLRTDRLTTRLEASQVGRRAQIALETTRVEQLLGVPQIIRKGS